MLTNPNAKRLRRGMTRGLTLGTAAATALATLMIAPAAQAAEVTLENPAAPSAAHGQALALDGLGLSILGAASSTSEFGGQAGGLAGLDLSVLGQNLSLGSVTLPLLKDPTDPNSKGLLEIGDVSLLRGYSATSTKTSAVASAGVITDEGALNLSDASDPDLAAAKIDLTALLGQLGFDGVTNGVIDELSLEVGALGSRVEKTDDKLSSEYTLAGVEANVGAPLVGGLTTGLDGLVSTLGTTLNGLLGQGGVLGGVLGSLEQVLNLNLLVLSLQSDGVRAEVNGLDTLVENVLDELVRTPLQNSTGSVDVNLAAGTVTLDLAELAIEGNGYEDINDLDPNTNLLDSKTLTAVTNGLTEALLGNDNPESLMSKLTAILTDHLWNSVSIDIFIDAKVKALLGILPIADTTVQLTGTLAEFTGYNGAKLENDNVKFELDLLGILPIGKLIEPIVKPLLNIVGGIAGPLLTVITQDVIGQVQPLLQGVISGLLTPVLDTLNPVLTSVATVTVNEQHTLKTPAVTGDLGAGSHTTNALAIELLPGLLGTESVSLELGNSSVKAAAVSAELTASPASVKPGDKVTIKGKNYGAGENVTIASALGATKTVKADATGAFTAEWPVPAAQKAGSVTFTATGVTSKRAATATVTITGAGTGANASANTNASASAAAAADGQATAAAQAAAQANASTNASAKATANAQAAAQAAATTNASTNASSKAEAAAATSAQAAANSKASSDSNANASAAANANASAAAKAAANANASTNASSSASANGASSNASSNGATANVNAAASASADSNANAAAKAAANADATTAASAKATANAQAAAKAAATATASANATAKADAASKAAALAAAKAKSDSDTNAKASAAAKANAAAAAKAAAISNASTNASGNNPNPNTLKCLEPGKKQVFLDTPSSHKFYTEIDWMYCMKYTTGIKSDAGLIYGPQMRLSREAMAAFIFRMEAPKSYKAPKVSPFADMKEGDKFYREIVWMYEAGLSTGIKQASGKPFYAPKERLSREAMAAFIYRLEAPKGYYAPAKSKMADMKPGQKFYTEVNWMVEEGLSTGIKVEGGNREYWPKARLSREAMAAFIHRLANEYRA